MKISVITPSFNSSGHIERAILSVLNQGYENFEHIIMDAGSKDGTVDILKKYKHLNWVSELDKGQSDAMNKGFKRSTGDVIVYLNADDEFVPHVFEKVIKIFNGVDRPQSTMTVFDLEVMDKNGKSHVVKPSALIQEIADPQVLNYPCNPISYFYHRSIQEKVGEFPEGLHLAMDYWFLLRAYSISNVIYTPMVTGIFHNYDNKTSDVPKSEIEVTNVLMNYLREKSGIGFLFNKAWLQAYRRKLRYQRKA